MRSKPDLYPNSTYKFTGHERDTEAGMVLDYMKARGYDPIIARFMQVDPLADLQPNVTPYHYTNNNPINKIDPVGRFDQFLITDGQHAVGHAETKGQDQFFHQNKDGEIRQLDPSNANDLAIIEDKLGSNSGFKDLVVRDGGTHAPGEVAAAAGRTLVKEGQSEFIDGSLEIADQTGGIGTCCRPRARFIVRC